MAGPLTGTSGALTMGDSGPTINIFEWTGEFIRDVYDDSNFNTATNARTKIGGMAVFRGTCRGTANADYTPALSTFNTEHYATGSDFTMKLDTVTGSTSRQFIFVCLISDIRVDVVKTDRIFVSVDFVSNDAIVAADFANV